VDGSLSATSRKDVSGEYDISNDVPLRIGSGAGDYFNGWMKQVRLYDAALSEEEMQDLCRGERDYWTLQDNIFCSIAIRI